ncbi:unnamed protein product [Auanema sp. JU1783]|nr:unnamed protein product [Auanema sp. JU1783]
MIRLLMLVISLILIRYSENSEPVEFSVEEPTNYQENVRHLHRLRHSRDSKPLPYKSAAFTITNPKSHKYESFSLNCPHVADASNSQVRIEVTWTLNDTIWLKIENGEKRIYNKLTTFNKRTVAGKKVLRVLLNNGRYFFDYDELTGDFSMEIRPVNVAEDAGVWQCHVTVYQRGNTHTLTSRSRVKTPHAHRSRDSQEQILHSQRDVYETFPLISSGLPADEEQSPKGTSSFSRTDKELVHISRDQSTRPKAVVFNRRNRGGSSGRGAKSRHTEETMDYETSLDYKEYNSPRSRLRSTNYLNSANHFPYLLSLLFYLTLNAF